MHEPPAHLTLEQLTEALHADYHLSVADLSFLPLGHDASAWVYRAQRNEISLLADGADRTHILYSCNVFPPALPTTIPP